MSLSSLAALLHGERPASRSCLECGAQSYESKPFCPDHIEHLPYVAELRRRMGGLMPSRGQVAQRRNWAHRRWRSGCEAAAQALEKHRHHEDADATEVALWVVLACAVARIEERRRIARSQQAAESFAWLLTSGPCQLCGNSVGEHEKTCDRCMRAVFAPRSLRLRARSRAAAAAKESAA